MIAVVALRLAHFYCQESGEGAVDKFICFGGILRENVSVGGCHLIEELPEFGFKIPAVVLVGGAVLFKLIFGL